MSLDTLPIIDLENLHGRQKIREKAEIVGKSQFGGPYRFFLVYVIGKDTYNSKKHSEHEVIAAEQIYQTRSGEIYARREDCKLKFSIGLIKRYSPLSINEKDTYTHNRW